MITKRELMRWLEALEHDHVAVNDGGLTLVEVAGDPPTETDAYLEVGGVPEPECLECGAPLGYGHATRCGRRVVGYSLVVEDDCREEEDD